ncbi:MAG: adenosylmethionine--8-amino-7-oxononanoate transaminase [Candidatus Omnitrophica bacterium]|nr:adenosylmethionine--8-amino-7-oxononanoate transaminase [Candidatus Omnitrophota bacterium]
MGRVAVLGTVPYLPRLKRGDILRKRPALNLTTLLRTPFRRSAAGLDKKFVWHPFTQMRDWLEDEPLMIASAQGSYLYDVQGRRYLDGVSSLWVNVHGHRRPEIDAAVGEQLRRVAHSTLLGLGNIPAAKLAAELIKIAPAGLAKVFYSDSGSTAVEVALKMAYQYWQNIGHPKKRQIVHLANSYHGDTLGSVSVGGIDLFHRVYRELVFPTRQLDFGDGYRAPRGKKYPDYFWECVDGTEAVFRRDHGRIAALIVEPLVQGAAGMIVWPPGVLRRLAGLCAKYGVLLIADEVATGFGRTGTMFACQQEKVTPDILCLAKGITGGYLPLAATLTTQKIFDGFLFDYQAQKTFFHGHTYTGNPLACAAALANLKIFKEEKTLAKLQPKIRFLTRGLRAFMALQHVGHIRQRGFMAGIELVENRETKKPFAWERRVGVAVCRRARERGVILRPLGNVIVLLPPLTISQDELRELLEVTYWAIEQVVIE